MLGAGVISSDPFTIGSLLGSGETGNGSVLDGGLLLGGESLSVVSDPLVLSSFGGFGVLRGGILVSLSRSGGIAVGLASDVASL